MTAFLKKTLALLATSAFLTAMIFLGLGYIVSWPAASPEKADVIIVLGGDDGLRVSKGAELYHAGFADDLLLTGLDSRYYRPGKLNWRERKLISLGIPGEAIHVDIISTSTWEEAANTLSAMNKNGWQRALVISDPPHMLRLQHTWTNVFTGSSKRFVLIATEPEWWHPLLWWNNETSSRFVLSEIKKNLYYAVMYY
ncbi:MAG: YdcF family protein [Prosthecochloris sp.]|uniref:YdcF family protein n=1 Tax=Prosthecochloris sp. TaxID=290513 RepID=UPI0013CCD609|nr:YdcF family protein [Prosthecochloris sp.]NEX11865.1 YdcF family protein [Prosthecochloris sp.]